MAQVTVTIDGKAYRMACDEGQEDHLIDLATQFDRYVNHLKTHTDICARPGLDEIKRRDIMIWVTIKGQNGHNPIFRQY